MKKLLLLFAICYLPVALFAQTSQTGSDYIARRLQVPLIDAPQKVPNASVSVSGNPGPATYFYWIVTNGLAGASSPAGPFQIINAPNTLTGSNFNQISWGNVLGAVSFDVLRTSTPGPPFGACNCAVATAVAGSSTNDQANALNAYTVNTFDPSTVLWTITNESVSAGVSQIAFRANGAARFTVSSNGAGGSVIQVTELAFGGLTASFPALFQNPTTGTEISVGKATGPITPTGIAFGISTQNTDGIFLGNSGIRMGVNSFIAAGPGGINSFATFTPDAGFSRTGPSTWAVGNGTAGNASGTLKLAALNNGGSLALPTSADTLVGQSTTDTLANKTITAPVVSDPTITGNTNLKRIKANQGSALVVGDVGSLSAGWGTTASVSAVSGNDVIGQISILSNGTGQNINSTLTLTFHDGTWTTAPLCIAVRGDGNAPSGAMIPNGTSATTAGFFFNATPVAGSIYVIDFICLGK
jgi:hypothetical protein